MKDYEKRKWKKLVGVGKNKTSKIISISHLILRQLGFRKGEDLEGKWCFNQGKLFLEVRRREISQEEKE